MPRRSLAEHRPWLLAAWACAILYYVLSDEALGETWQIAVKAGAVLSLAIYAIRRHGGTDAKILAGSLVLAAVGAALDVLQIDFAAIALFFSYAAAIALFLRHRRERPVGSQKALAITVLLVTPLLALWRTQSADVGIYALTLGAMGFAGWMSAFPRYRVGTGTMLVVAAGLLSFLPADPTDTFGLAAWLEWPLFFVGQFMIATGVVQTLRHQDKLRREAGR